MRKSMLLLAVLLILLTGCSQKEESAPIFIMTEYNQEFLKDGVVTGTDCYTYSYNEDGLAIYRERYQDGSFVSCTSWEYDDYGNPVSITAKEMTLYIFQSIKTFWMRRDVFSNRSYGLTVCELP